MPRSKGRRKREAPLRKLSVGTTVPHDPLTALEKSFGHPRDQWSKGQWREAAERCADQAVRWELAAEECIRLVWLYRQELTFRVTRKKRPGRPRKVLSLIHAPPGIPGTPGGPARRPAAGTPARRRWTPERCRIFVLIVDRTKKLTTKQTGKATTDVCALDLIARQEHPSWNSYKRKAWVDSAKFKLSRARRKLRDEQENST